MTSKAPTPQQRSRSRSASRWTIATLAICISVALSACGSTSSGPSGPVDSAGLAAATKVVDAATQQPTTLPITAPISKPVPKGKTIAFISCGTPECQQEGGLVKEATDALGWTLSVINTQGTPESEKAAFDQVVRQKYNAVLYSAIDRSIFASDLAAMKANGTFIAGCCTTDAANASTGIDYVNEVPSQTAGIGELMADWVISQSQGKGSVVYVQLPAIQILQTSLNVFQQTMKQNCPTDCSTDVLNIPVTAIGVDVPTRVVAYLRAHPNVKYVAICSDGLTIGLPAALKAAGLSDVKIIGQGATATNLQYIHSGQEAASIAFPYYESLWGLVDAVARHEAGVPLAPSAVPALWLLNSSNAPNTNNLFPVVQGSESQFKQLWGVS